jgi:hypothetical protein
MRRIISILGSAIFLVVAPGIVAAYLPWRICPWHVGAPLLGASSFRVLGVLLIAVGLPVLLESFSRFALQGLGTPAPILPTRHLVVGGSFRNVRNPMYVAALSVHKKQNFFMTGKGGCPSAPSRAPVYGVHWSGAETLDGRSGRISRSIQPRRNGN